ncbi:MAG: zinc transporter ZntB [Rhodospirillaceae bacterium]
MSDLADDDGFVYTGILDGWGGAKPIGIADLTSMDDASTIEWVHLDITKDQARTWLTDTSGLPPLAVEGLSAPDTEPRCAEFENGVMIILREVNTKENARPEDMISLRLWIGAGRIISARRRHLAAIEDIKVALAKNQGPKTAGEFLCAVGRNMARTKNETISALLGELDEIEEILSLGRFIRAARPKLAKLRRRAIQLSRFFRPQRIAFQQLSDRRPPWIDGSAADELAELSAEFGRLAGDIDAILGRAQVAQDELRAMENFRTGRINLTLTVVAAIFLPLTFVTGLMGMNVGGIPFAENKIGFWALTGGLAAVGVALWAYFRHRRYF